jgi:geranylgeranyl diphosphate synthase type I
MDFKKEFGPKIKMINDDLERRISEIENENLRNAMMHYPKAGGKRLRPIFTMLVADAISKSGTKAMPFGVAVEMAHNFTLIHDDIMDNDDTRRGMKTTHIVFGMPAAILAGDALFAKAFEAVGGMDVDSESKNRLNSLLARAVLLVAEGQQMDMDFEISESIRDEDYLKMIERKTAVLLSAATQGGAIAAGAKQKLQEAMFEFGRLMGLGFQIWDDVLDLRADEKALGKPVGSDIRNGKKTLIIIYALEVLDGQKKERLKQILGREGASKKEVDEAIAILDSAGAIDRAERIALEMISKAKKLLDDLPEGEDRQKLKDLTDFMIKREW